MHRSTASQAKTVLITGATAGIGRHVALHLARAGYTVYATGRNQAALDSLTAEAEGTRLFAVAMDVTDAEAIERVRAQIERDTDGRGVDVLVNNAGFGQVGPMELISDEDLRRQFDTNVFGLMAVTRAFIGGMRVRGQGRVINVSSIGGRVTFPFMGAYNATKYAVESMSDALRNEVAPFGIKVVLIEPGVIRSEFADRAVGSLARYRDERSPYAAVMARADDLQRQADSQAVGPECIAEAIEHAITARRPRARYVAPRRARLLLALVAVLPTRWVDAAMRAMLGLGRRKLVGAVTPAAA
jgi:short-subunit dehydrogenase